MEILIFLPGISYTRAHAFKFREKYKLPGDGRQCQISKLNIYFVTDRGCENLWVLFFLVDRKTPAIMMAAVVCSRHYADRGETDIKTLMHSLLRAFSSIKRRGDLLFCCQCGKIKLLEYSDNWWLRKGDPFCSSPLFFLRL